MVRMTGRASKDSPIEFVASSATRESVLRAVADAPVTTRDLCELVDGSESAVYAATSDLRKRSLLESRDGEDDRWHLTGTGVVVAEAVTRRRRLDDLLASDPDYWANHDSSVLPDSFRCRLPSLTEATVNRTSAADPTGLVRLLHERIRSSAEVDVVSTVHFPGLGQTLREVCSERPGRLVVTDAVIDEIRQHDDGVVPIPEHLSLRVADVAYTLAITDETTFVSLPTMDGEYDPRTELVAEDDEAHRWGRDLFEHCWARATPIEDVAVESEPL
jgi:predicted transcriptional regulator